MGIFDNHLENFVFQRDWLATVSNLFADQFIPVAQHERLPVGPGKEGGHGENRGRVTRVKDRLNPEGVGALMNNDCGLESMARDY